MLALAVINVLVTTSRTFQLYETPDPTTAVELVLLITSIVSPTHTESSSKSNATEGLG